VPNLVRFGPFDLDLEAAELRSKDHSVLLPQQQFQILYMLLLAEGGVVSREEIRRHLWPNDTVVEFDRSINTAMMKLRLALGDTGDRPRYIETLVRRGYRLIVPIQRQENKSTEPLVREGRQDSLVGQKVSHYRVLGILGGGGMGLVYKGEDLKLDRPVALKFLPEEIASDPLVVQRFEREARTASSLNHPNICTIYEVEEHNGQPFIVMELLEGTTLRELITQYADQAREGSPGIPLIQLLDIAVQIADGLNAAHENGIIHRDMKPANIIVTPLGKVKILDFGLAKAGGKTTTDPFELADAPDSQAPASREVSIGLTLSRTGTPMGTAGYMSPEQVRGEKLDARSDLFSFGSILYEMAAGSHPFHGRTTTALSEAILRDAPTPLPAGIPSGLRSVILRCLEKSADDRYQRVTDVRAALQALQDPNSRWREMEGQVNGAGLSGDKDHRNLRASTPADGAIPRAKKGLWRWVAAAGVVLLLICAAIWHSQPRSLIVTNAVQITNDGKAKSPMNLPVTDGVHLYFIEGMPWTSGSGIAQMSATGGETTWITTTLQEMLTIYNISPDGSKLLVGTGVAVDSSLASELWIQPLPAGAPYRVGNIKVSAASWTPDGKHIVYAYGQTLVMANQDGSEPRPFAKIPGVARAIRYSTDGRVIRFFLLQEQGSSSSIWEMDADGRGVHPLLPNWSEQPYQCCGNWSPDGEYYYFVAGRGTSQAIWVMPERRSVFGRTAARPSRLTSGPLRFSGPLPSSDGKRLFVIGEEPRVELFRYDLRTQRFDPYIPGFSAGPVDFSPDGKWMAYISYPDGTLWRSRLDGRDKVQLTLPPLRAYAPRWSPDGSRIAFYDVQSNEPWRIYLLPSSGGSPELLEQPGAGVNETDPTWTPDGKSVVFAKTGGSGKEGIAIYRYDFETKKTFHIPDSEGLFSPRVSPDGRYISALADGQKKLLLFDTNTSRWSNLMEGEQIGCNEWSHDGEHVYSRENRGGAAEVVRVRIKDRAVEHVVSLKDFPQLADIFTVCTGLTPDDAPLLMRDRSVQELYALDLDFH